MRDWLRGLSREDKRRLGEDIKDVEFSWPLGMPLVRALGDSLWEIRSNLTDGRTARVLFSVEDDCMVLLHGFIKKGQKTPRRDLELARRRRKGKSQ